MLNGGLDRTSSLLSFVEAERGKSSQPVVGTVTNTYMYILMYSIPAHPHRPLEYLDSGIYRRCIGKQICACR